MKKKKKKEASHFLEMFDKYKSLLYELTRKNIKLKYRDSWLGIFWSFLQPLLTMAVLSVVYSVQKENILFVTPFIFFRADCCLNFSHLQAKWHLILSDQMPP